MDLLNKIPCWYITPAIIWSIYQGIRGIIEHRLFAKNSGMSQFEKIFILYIHDFAFRFICTMAGFFSLYVCYILTNISKLSEISTSTSALIAFFFIVGLIIRKREIIEVQSILKMIPRRRPISLHQKFNPHALSTSSLK